MKYLGIILNLPTFFIFIMLGFAMKKGEFDETSSFCGYRSKAARSSKEAAEYANKTFGVYLIVISIVSLIVSILLCLFISGTYSTLVTVLSPLIIVILLFLGIIKVEYDLKHIFNLEDKKTDSRKIISMFVVVIVVIIMVVVMTYSSLSNTEKPFKIDVNSKNIIIDGWGSAKINLNDVKEVKLLKEAPNVEWNNGGGSIGNKIFGNEHLSNLGSTHCFVENSNEDVIYINTSNTKYLIGFNDSDKTVSVFNTIKKEKE